MGLNLPVSSQEQANCTNYQLQVEMEHGADQNENDVGPWKADVKQSTAKCGGSDSVFILATVVGKAVIYLRFDAFAENNMPIPLLVISETFTF